MIRDDVSGLRNSGRESRALDRWRAFVRLGATVAAVVMLPPFLLLAVLPMMLFLLPVALIGIPFIVPAMLTGSLAARTEEKQRASYRPLARPMRVVQ